MEVIEKLIPWAFTVVSLVFCILSYTRNGTQTAKSELKSSLNEISAIKESVLKANIKLDQVCATTNETRTDIKALRNELTEQDKRLTIVERDLKTVFEIVERLQVSNAEKHV